MARTGVAVKNGKTTAVATTNIFEDDLADLKKRLAAPSGDKIKVEDKAFKLPSGANANELDVVIVDFVYANSYYETAYQKGTVVPPTCFSIHPEQKGACPSENSPEAQCDNCDGCPANQFGSNGTGKLCQNRVLIAVLPADATEETPFAILDISPTAIKGFQQYVASVARGLGRPPYAVVTHVDCDPTKKYDVVQFSDPQPIEDDEQILLLRGRREEARERLMTEPDVKAMQAANDAKKPAGRGGLKAPIKRRA